MDDRVITIQDVIDAGACEDGVLQFVAQHRVIALPVSLLVELAGDALLFTPLDGYGDGYGRGTGYGNGFGFGLGDTYGGGGGDIYGRCRCDGSGYGGGFYGRGLCDGSGYGHGGGYGGSYGHSYDRGGGGDGGDANFQSDRPRR